MELKLIINLMIKKLTQLLIEPFGIETRMNNTGDVTKGRLLIEPFGIETREAHPCLAADKAF